MSPQNRRESVSLSLRSVTCVSVSGASAGWSSPPPVTVKLTAKLSAVKVSRFAAGAWKPIKPSRPVLLMSAIVQAVLDAGFVLELFREFPFTVYERWPFLEERHPGVWFMPDDRPELPLMFSLRARRPV